MADPADEFEFEIERAYDRDELAAVFREFAAALAEDRPLRVADGERLATISFPPRVIAELEAERETDTEPPVAELELELEWDDADGSSLRLEESDRDAPGIVIDEDGGAATSDETTASDDESRASRATTDPATATMPADAVAGADERDSDAARSAAERENGDRSGRFEIYEDRAGEWRWRLVHWNGNIVADSGEGYASRSNARRAARSVMHTAPNATVEDRTD